MREHCQAQYVCVSRDDTRARLRQITEMLTRIHHGVPVRWYLREWRKKRGLTLEQVAERLDTTRGLISEFERGAKRVNDDWVAGFCWAYDVEPAQLLHHPDSPTLDERLKDASDEQKTVVIQFIDFTLRRSA
jgi:transcriptional regulator with XRE-family HTH domain